MWFFEGFIHYYDYKIAISEVYGILNLHKYFLLFIINIYIYTYIHTHSYIQEGHIVVLTRSGR